MVKWEYKKICFENGVKLNIPMPCENEIAKVLRKVKHKRKMARDRFIAAIMKIGRKKHPRLMLNATKKNLTRKKRKIRPLLNKPTRGWENGR